MILSYVHFFSVILNLYLGCFILLKDPRRRLHQACSACHFTFALWSFGKIVTHNPFSPPGSVFLFDSISSLGWITFPIPWLVFVLVFTGLDRKIKSRSGLYLLLYSVAAVFIYKQFTGFLAARYLKQYYGWSTVWPDNVWLRLYYLYYILVMTTGLALLFWFSRTTGEKDKKKEAEIIFGFTLTVLVVGTVTDVLLPELGIYAVPDMADLFAGVFWAALLAYVTAKYEFLNVTPAMAGENIIRTMADALILIDGNGRIARLNPAALAMLGYRQEEIEQGLMAELLSDPASLRFLTEKIGRGEEFRDRDLFFKRKNGTIAPISCSISFLPDRSGNKIKGVVCIVRDLTERNKAEEEIKNLAKFLSESSSPMLRLTRDGTVIYANPPSLIILNRLGVKLGEPAPPEWREIIRKTFETGFREELEVIHGDLVFSFEVVPVPETDYANFYGYDVTERKKAEENLAREREHLAITLRSIADGVVTTDTEGKIILFNQAAEEITGWTQAEAIGKSFEKTFFLFNDETRLPCDNSIEKIIREGHAAGCAGGTLLLTRDGWEKSISAVGAPIRDRDRKVIGVVVVFRDITERRKMEKDLLRMQNIESLGTLAGGIAHDFNNILTVIMGNSSVGRMHLEDREELSRDLQEIERACRQARDLTRQLLTFSKGGDPVKETMVLSALLREAINLVVSGSGIHVNLELPDGLWPLEADRVQIIQAFNNLLINARQAMADVGTITLRGENVVVKEDSGLPVAGGRYVKIAVLDQGCGIPEEDQARIFTPFFTTKKEGNGLGLSIAYSIVKKHGGHISFESGSNRGTTFYIHLPASDKSVPAAPPAAGKPSRTGEPESEPRTRVLVMDDEEAIRRLLGRMLGNIGYEVECTQDGSEAVEAYGRAKQEGRPFAAVILDVVVPGGMGGRETIGELKAMDNNVRAIVSSGYSRDPVIADYRDYGFQGVVLKPYDVKELSEVLIKVISRSRR